MSRPLDPPKLSASFERARATRLQVVDDVDVTADPYRDVPTVGEQAWVSADVDDEMERKLASDRLLGEEVGRLRRQRDAQRRLLAEDAPPLRRMRFSEFLNSPQPERLVPGLLYRDSLSRMWGAPSCGKSFLALDLAMRVALGLTWRGEQLEQGIVYYVMAEGQAVNVARALAWCDRHAVRPTDLEDWFVPFPDPIQLTEEGIRPFLLECERDRPALIILDTKNAMMAGEENSATDTAVMRRSLDAIRKASGGACVLLIDHAGYAGTRARGSSAASAAMDTEVQVSKDDESSPPLVTAEITRDKAGEIGTTWRFHLRMHDPAPVLLEVDDDGALGSRGRATEPSDAWQDARLALPPEVTGFEGVGAKLVEPLARFMAHEAGAGRGDLAKVGVSRAEAAKALRDNGDTGRDDTSIRRAWSALLNLGVIAPAEGVKSTTGRHVWTRS